MTLLRPALPLSVCSLTRKGVLFRGFSLARLVAMVTPAAVSDDEIEALYREVNKFALAAHFYWGACCLRSVIPLAGVLWSLCDVPMNGVILLVLWSTQGCGR
jgi:hypothetical protein